MYTIANPETFFFFFFDSGMHLWVSIILVFIEATVAAQVHG